jgi:hypothetical protein
MRHATPLPGLVLVRDAGLTSDPLRAIGCGWALQSAALLADSTAPALAGVEPLASALRRYRRAPRRHLAPHHLATPAVRQMNPIQHLLFSAATRDPQTETFFHHYAERSIPPRRLPAPGALGRAARVGMWRRFASRGCRWVTSGNWRLLTAASACGCGSLSGRADECRNGRPAGAQVETASSPRRKQSPGTALRGRWPARLSKGGSGPPTSETASY